MGKWRLKKAKSLAQSHTAYKYYHWTWTKWPEARPIFWTAVWGSPGITDSQLLLDCSEVECRHKEDLPFLHWAPSPQTPLTVFYDYIIMCSGNRCLALGLCKRQERHNPFYPTKHLAGERNLNHLILQSCKSTVVISSLRKIAVHMKSQQDDLTYSSRSQISCLINSIRWLSTYYLTHTPLPF